MAWRWAVRSVRHKVYQLTLADRVARFRDNNSDAGPDGTSLRTDLLRPGLPADYPQRVRGVVFGGFLGGICLDAQLSVATAHAVMRTYRRHLDRGFASMQDVQLLTYDRWMSLAPSTGTEERHRARAEPDGALARSLVLRAPVSELAVLGAAISDGGETSGLTCMPTAVVGLADVGDPFAAGEEIACTLYRNPATIAAGGYLAAVTSQLTHGVELEGALSAALGQLRAAAGGGALAKQIEGILAGTPLPATPVTAAQCLAVAFAEARLATTTQPSRLPPPARDPAAVTVRSVTGQLLGAAGLSQPVPDVGAFLDELTQLAEDVSWTMGRRARELYMTDDWWSRYPPA